MALPWAATCGEATGMVCFSNPDKLCEQAAMKTLDKKGRPIYGACKKHGGKSLKGMAHPNAKTLPRSQFLPQRLVPDYETAFSDTDLLSLNRDMALVEARIVELYKKLDTGEHGGIWKDLKECQDELEGAVRNANPQEIMACTKRHRQIMERGWNERFVWRDITDMIDRRQRLVESERKRMQELNQMISSKHLLVIASRVVESFRKSVIKYLGEKDEATARAILSETAIEVGRILSAHDSGRVEQTTYNAEPLELQE